MPKTGESGESRRKRMVSRVAKEPWYPFRAGDTERYKAQTRTLVGDKYKTVVDNVAEGFQEILGPKKSSDEKTKADIRGKPKT